MCCFYVLMFVPSRGGRSQDKQGSANSVNIAQWRETRMCQIQAAGHLVCANSQIFASCLDASRIGQTALDIVLHCLWVPSKGSLALPPAVSLGFGMGVGGTVKTEIADPGKFRTTEGDRQNRQNRHFGPGG